LEPDGHVLIETAARLLGTSPATIRRRLQQDLLGVEGTRPQLVDGASFRRAREDLLRSLDVPDAAEMARLTNAIADLEGETDRLRAVILHLTAAERSLLDGIDAVTAK